MEAERGIRLFSYGTLQQLDVQRKTFGRTLEGWRDSVIGYRVGTLKITDAAVIETSGSDEHPALLPSREPGARIEGSVFLLSAGELAAADEYEVAEYTRIEVPLASGATAWAYVLDAGAGR